MNTEPAESGPATDDAGELNDNPSTEFKSLDDALDAAIQGAEKGSDSEEAKPAEAKPGDEATDTEDKATASGETDKDSAGDKRSDEDAPKTDDKPDDAASEAQTIRAKEHWTADQKAAFEALPTPEAKQAMLSMANDLEAGFTRKSQEASEQIKTAQAIDGLFSDEEKQQLQRAGHTSVSLLGQLTQFQRWYQQDPIGYVQYVMKTAGIDPSQVLSQEQPGTEGGEDTGDPEVPDLSALEQNVSSLQQTLPNLVAEAVQTAVTNQTQQQQVETVNSGIETFKGQTDESGQPKYPHFDRVRGVMGALMERYPDHYNKLPDHNARMDAAYQDAIKSDPEFGPQHLQSEAQRIANEGAAKREEEEAAAEKKATVDRAKNAAGPSPSTSTAPAKSSGANDLDSILNAALTDAGVN